LLISQPDSITTRLPNKAALGHHFDKISKAELVTQVPTHTQDDDFAVKVTAVEQPVNVYLLTHCVLAIVKTRA
jgi:hypothetical protein